MPPVRRVVIAFLALGLLLGSCGDDDDTAAPATTESEAADTSTSTEGTAPGSSTPETSTAPPITIGTGSTCASGSSSTAVDEDRGLYATWVTGIDVVGRTLSVDVIQWLVGPDAVAAYQADHPEDPEGPPNDYYIVNENGQVRDFPVADDVSVRILASGAELTDSSFEDLPDAFAIRPSADPGRLTYSPYWVAVDDGQVTGICEQYVP